MRIRIGCSFVHDTASPTPAVVLAEPHGEVRERIVEERWSSEPDLFSSTYTDLYNEGKQVVDNVNDLVDSVDEIGDNADDLGEYDDYQSQDEDTSAQEWAGR